MDCTLRVSPAEPGDFLLEIKRKGKRKRQK
jgi:hypothetical protein